MTLPGFAAVANHLWQSTISVVAVWLLTLLLMNNRAAVRYRLWLAASVKFLIPFSLLVSAGSGISWHNPQSGVVPPQIPASMQEIGRVFLSPATPPLVTVADPARLSVPAVLLGIWICGVVVCGFRWVRWWRRMRAVQRTAIRMDMELPIPVMASPLRLEPGVFGIQRPVLLLPEGITDYLMPAQLNAIIAHELCHVRRRDNLTAAIHMAVETIFWFHPFVWWIRARLVEERERACDEAVVASAVDPRVYAEGILNVCKFYAAAPLVCAAGVSGANLKKRIEEIMSHRISRSLGAGKKALLAAAGIGALAAPVVIGILGGPKALAQPQQRLAFEVASVKENKSPDPRNGALQFLPGGKFVARSIPFPIVLATAFDVPFQSNRITGGPDWLRRTVFDIEASAGDGVIPSGTPVKERDAKIRLMLQTLFADRFKMVVRREMKDLPVYSVTIAKNGPKLELATVQENNCADVASGPGNPTGCHIIGGGQGRGIHGAAISISDVATFVGNWSDRPVIDKTGLTSLYNIQTTGWQPMRARPPRPPGQEATAEDRFFEDPSTPTLFQIFGQLGLALEPSRAPVEMFVIESAEKPSEN